MERYALLHYLQKQRQFARRMAPLRPLSAYAASRLRLTETIGPASGARTVNAPSWRPVPAEEIGLSEPLEAMQPLLEQFASQVQEDEPSELVAQESAPAAVQEAMKSARPQQRSIETQRAPAAEQSEERQTLVPPAPGEQDAPALDTLAHETSHVEQQEERQPASQQERPGPRRTRIEERPQPVAGQRSDLALGQHPASARPATKAQREAEREAAELFTASESRSPQEWFALLAQARQQAQPVRQQTAMPNPVLKVDARGVRANVENVKTVNTSDVSATVKGTDAQAVRTGPRTLSAGVASVDAVGVKAVKTVRAGAVATPTTDEAGLREKIAALNAEDVSPASGKNSDQREVSVRAEEASRNMSEAANVRESFPDPKEAAPVHSKGGHQDRPGDAQTRSDLPDARSDGLNVHSNDADMEADRARPTDVEPVSIRARQALKPLIGFDPADARIHRGPAAARFVAAQRADAVTLGDDIFLAAGHASDEPQTFGLLAHELTHVARHHEPRHVPPVVASSAASEAGEQADRAEAPQPITSSSNGSQASADEEELAEQVERQVTRHAKESAQAPGAFAPMSATRASAPSNARENIAGSGWGGLPAPWEPLPDWLASSASTDGFEPLAGPSQTRPSLPSLPAGSGNGQHRTRSNSPASADGKAGSGQAAPAAQRAGLERSLPEDGTQTPRQESIPQQQSKPEPDLDKLARQVYAVLKRRLDVERRRMS